MHDDSPDPEHPRLGAAFVSRRTAPGVHVFGVVSSDGTAAGLRPSATRVASTTSANEPRTLRLKLYGLLSNMAHLALPGCIASASSRLHGKTRTARG